MKPLVWLLLAALVLLHQWDPFARDTTILVGGLPLPLVYHAGLSIAAACVWFLATKFAWPVDAEVAEELANQPPAKEAER